MSVEHSRDVLRPISTNHSRSIPENNKFIPYVMVFWWILGYMSFTPKNGCSRPKMVVHGLFTVVHGFFTLHSRCDLLCHLWFQHCPESFPSPWVIPHSSVLRGSWTQIQRLVWAGMRCWEQLRDIENHLLRTQDQIPTIILVWMWMTSWPATRSTARTNWGQLELVTDAMWPFTTKSSIKWG